MPSVILLSVLFLLSGGPLLRTAQLLFHGESAQHFSVDFAVDGVKAKWAYASFPGFAFRNEKILGMNVSEWSGGTFRPPVWGKSIADNGPLNINEKIFQQGIGTRAPSKIAWDLKGGYARFSCKVGLDRSVSYDYNHGIIYSLIADGKEIFRTPKIRSDADPFPIDCSVAGVHELVLFADNTQCDDTLSNADWVDIHFEKAVPLQPSPTAAFTK